MLWLPEIPTEDGYYWFYGFFNDMDPQIMMIACHMGNFYGFAEAKSLPPDLFIGLWRKVRVPEEPVEKDFE